MTSKPDDNNPQRPADEPEPEQASEEQDSAGPDTMSEVLKCPVCGFPYRVGELTCSNCHYIFVSGGRTQHIEATTDLIAPKDWPTGEVIVPDRKPIVFEIEGQELALPTREDLIIGRSSGNPADIAPDVDLTPYGAADCGVSRLHARIRRKGVLLYVIDMGSTNGTWLNGRKLIPDGERLLRHGDQLRLSRLKIRVRF